MADDGDAAGTPGDAICAGAPHRRCPIQPSGIRRGRPKPRVITNGRRRRRHHRRRHPRPAGNPATVDDLRGRQCRTQAFAV